MKYNPQVKLPSFDHNFPAPIKVKPIIRTTRWTLLIAGILYGADRLRELKNNEECIHGKNMEIVKERQRAYDTRKAELARLTQKEVETLLNISLGPTDSNQGNSKGSNNSSIKGSNKVTGKGSK